jgi:hypothetical protein
MILLKMLQTNGQGSSQGILACRAGTRAPPAGTRAPPAGTHETEKKRKNVVVFFNSFFMFYACISLQNMQKCIAIHFCFPFIEENACF